MSDKYIEKTFIYLLVISVALHVGMFALIYYLPHEQKPPPKEPVFIDLQQMPEPKPQMAPRQQETKRFSEQRQRVPKEMAPRGNAPRDSFGPAPRPAARPQPQEAGKSAQRQAPPARQALPLPSKRQEAPLTPGSSVASLLRPKSQSVPQIARPQLFPGAQRLAKLEEGYRRKFENDVAEGDTRFLNSDDIQFGSFLRRFETAVYGVWRYPQEAAQNGIEGVTPVRITFNRHGEITKVELLESSGARILDDEVMRTLRAIGPVGSFPRNYDKEEFHLIAFFQYGGARKSLR
ncbi:energy transducer TonB [Geobacter sp. AOG2]|uniref:energy transducer TonB n=1 Tax=Geobacter sp. AOG2 TaxID=1566347 RepID=UPI001CC6A3C4|nr:energy transducer TonB [Geobacter sp. AOG2]GFE60192.1 TonB-dependent receptor [Geobacter sp. AOG2]